MARHDTITIVHKCGHAVARAVTVPPSARAGWRQELTARPCRECQIHEEVLLASTWAEEHGLPPILAEEGNHPAGYRAELIRAELLPQIERVFATFIFENEIAEAVWRKAVDVLKNQRQAKFWLRHSRTPPEALLRNAARHVNRKRLATA